MRLRRLGHLSHSCDLRRGAGCRSRHGRCCRHGLCRHCWCRSFHRWSSGLWSWGQRPGTCSWGCRRGGRHGLLRGRRHSLGLLNHRRLWRRCGNLSRISRFFHRHILAHGYVLLVVPILALPIAFAIGSPDFRVVAAHNSHGGQKSPEEDVVGPPCVAAAHGGQVLVLVEALFANWARHTPLWASSFRSLSPGLRVWVLVEPLADAVPAEKVRAAGKLWTAPNHVGLANFADELFRLLKKLLLKDFDLLCFEPLHFGHVALVPVLLRGLVRNSRLVERGGNLLFSFGFGLLVLFLFLVLLLRRLLLLNFLLAACGRILLVIVTVCPCRNHSLLILRQVEVFVDGLIVHAIRVLASLDIVVDTFSHYRKVADLDGIIVDRSEQLLELLDVPPSPLLGCL
mmetsp:Transcript_56230/g.131387  ORF Transcript_56230/g.131387 Transcript_56230/m.131387 type:complete len:398 (-) Transcript_56230:606-1799(-)